MDCDANRVRPVLATHLAHSAQFRLKILTGWRIAIGTATILWRFECSQLLRVGGLLVFLAYLASVAAPLETIVQSSTTAAGVRRWRRVREAMAEEDLVADSPGKAAPLARPTAESRSGSSVTFGHDLGRPVLHDVSAEATPGSVVAIVAPSRRQEHW